MAGTQSAVEKKLKEVEALRERVRQERTAATATDPKAVEAAQLVALEREEQQLRVELATTQTAKKLTDASAVNKGLTGKQLLAEVTAAHKAAGLKIEGDAPLGQVSPEENPALNSSAANDTPKEN